MTTPTLPAYKGWLAEQDPEKLAESIGILRAHPDAFAQYVDHATGDEGFAHWLYLVDRRVLRTTMGAVSMFDLADWASRDSYEEGLSPRDAVDAIREYDDLYDAFLSEQEG